MPQHTKDNEMDIFTKTNLIKKDGLSIIRKMFNLIWFKNKRIPTFAILLQINIVVCFLLTLTIYEIRLNITTVAKHITITATDFQVVYKTFFFAWEYKRIMRMKETIDEKFWDLSSFDRKIKQKLRRHFSIIQFSLLTNFISVIIGTTILVIFPMVPPSSPNRNPLPIQIWLPQSVKLDNNLVYVLLYLLLSLNAVFGITVVIMYDSWFVYCAQHLYVQLQLLKEKFKILANFKSLDDIYIVHSPKFQKIIKKRLQYCMKHHATLIRFGYDLRKMTSIVNTLQSATTLVSLIFLGFSISKVQNSMLDVSEILIFIISIIVQILIYTLNGTEIEFESEAVARATYESKWYLFQGTLRKDMAFAIRNAQKPITLTAGGLFNMNNQALVQIFRLAFSCITLLPSQDENN